jgi:hypothetical protein
MDTGDCLLDLGFEIQPRPDKPSMTDEMMTLCGLLEKSPERLVQRNRCSERD